MAEAVETTQGGLQAAEALLLEGLSRLLEAQNAAREAGYSEAANDISHAASIARAVAKHIKGKLTANAN